MGFFITGLNSLTHEATKAEFRIAIFDWCVNQKLEELEGQRVNSFFNPSVDFLLTSNNL